MSRFRTPMFALVFAAFMFLFWDVIVKLVRDWDADQNYSHGFLVVPLVVYILWRERAAFAALQPRPSAAGLGIVALSLALLVAGVLGAELYLTRLAMLGSIVGAVVFLWGFQYLPKMAFVLLLLLLTIPIPSIIFNQIAFPLQLIASRFGETVIASCGIPVLREGNVITLATTSLEVAEACSGIRSLVSLLTLALVWGYFSSSPTWLRWLLALSSVPIAIFSNALRVAGTGIAAHFVGPEAAQGFFHSFSGWMVFLVAGILLLTVHRLAVWLAPRAAVPRPVPVPAATDAAPFARLASASDGTVTRGLVLAAVFGVLALSLTAATRTEAAGLRVPLTQLPLTIGEWTGENFPPLEKPILETLRVDEYVSRSYTRPGGPSLSLYVGYYRSQRQGQTMHSPLNCLPGAGWEPTNRSRIEIPRAAAGGDGKGGGTAVVNRLIIQKGVARQLVLYWYQAHGRIVASEYWGKIYTVLDSIRLNRSDGSMVRVVVPIRGEGPEAERAAERAGLAFVSELLPALSMYLDGE